MYQPELVQARYGIADPAGVGERRRFVERTLLLYEILKRLAGQVLHHHVAGGVLGERAEHLYDARVCRVRHLLPAVEEPLLLAEEVLRLPVRRRPHGEAVASAAFWKELLDCNRRRS